MGLEALEGSIGLKVPDLFDRGQRFPYHNIIRYKYILLYLALLCVTCTAIMGFCFSVGAIQSMLLVVNALLCSSLQISLFVCTPYYLPFTLRWLWQAGSSSSLTLAAYGKHKTSDGVHNVVYFEKIISAL